jgi:plastocyanin
MRHREWLAVSLFAASLSLGCGESTGRGLAGVSSDGGPPPTAVTVMTGTNFFRSSRNGSRNAAVDTVAVGGSVIWMWSDAGMVPHNVQSIGTPSFASSSLETGDGSRYTVTFPAPGTYRYNCAIHGDLMTGTIVVR